MEILAFLQKNDWALLGVTLLPILAWIFYFQSVNKEKGKYVLLAFIAGMMSVFAIKLYEQYWNMGLLWFSHSNLFTYLSQLISEPSIAQFLIFIAMSIFVAVSFFILVAVLMFILEVGSGDNTISLFWRKAKCIRDTPTVFIFAGLFMGFLAWGAWIALPSFVWKGLMVGALEEYVKHLCLRFADEDKIINFDDAISFSIIVALGFAFVENYFYFKDHLNDPYMFRGIFILRSTLSVLAHVGFSALFGYFYGLAHFSDEIYKNEVQEGRHKLLEGFHRVCHINGKRVFHQELMLEGMAIAMLLHAAFNSALEGYSIQMALPIVFIMFFIVMNLFHRKDLHHRRGHILR